MIIAATWLSLAVLASVLVIGILIGVRIAAPRKGWKWSMQPRPRGAIDIQDEVRPALRHMSCASKRLAMYNPSGRDALDSIDYARRHLDLAARAVYQVDPHLRPAREDEAPIV